MTDTKEPREFLIDDTHQLNRRVATNAQDAEEKLLSKGIHVIEFTAYEKLKSELIQTMALLEAEMIRYKRAEAELDEARSVIETLEADIETKEFYCPICKSCGIDECCPAERCIYPGIKAETLKEAKDEVRDMHKQNQRAIELINTLENIIFDSCIGDLRSVGLEAIEKFREENEE